MKKTILNFGLIAIVTMITMTSCNDLHNGLATKQKNENCAEQVRNSQNKQAEVPFAVFEVSARVGHNGAECDGCIKMNGQLYHVDCLGYGNYCVVNSSVKLTLQSEDSLTYYQGETLYEYELTTEDFFLFPSRSLWVYNEFTGSECWMNIPEQMLYRNSETHQFYFENIYFSDKQIYANE